MKRSVNNRRAAVVLGTIAALLTNIACSKPKTEVASTKPIDAIVRPAAFKTVAATDSKIVPASSQTKNVSEVKSPIAKPVTYRSRDYGVSFVYPWQYKYSSAKTIANVESLQPKSDGFESQFSLIRVDIPKGFYPDTNFDGGYFTLSLNQDLSQEECKSMMNNTKLSETINGVEFHWTESSKGGHGEASKVRNYVAFANDTCYEIEMGVKTKSDRGLAREVEPDQVMQRLEGILKSVKIADGAPVGGTQLESSTAVQDAGSGK